MKRIICIGNRYAPGDAAGPIIYERLARRTLPDDIEVIEGGLGGLDLLPLIEGSRRVIFVDSVSGFSKQRGIVVLEASDIASVAQNEYNHAAGIAYLVRVLPQVCKEAVPQILLVGVEGETNEEILDEAAALTVKLALGENHPETHIS